MANLRFFDYELFEEFMWNQDLQEAFEELWRDFLSPIPPSRFYSPCEVTVYNMIKLCELEPYSWTYNQPNPDKSRWSLEAHFARFCIKAQIVRRRLLGLPLGPLNGDCRAFLLQGDCEIAKLMFKMRHAHNSFNPFVDELHLDA
ncbi:hypothetical protein G7Z17_g10569 [Cylindrodendrum hubeiense]|uniref:Uncharacterized protein n=1 Tax=Cylindrodendrum hubeiense TaxID=595255 RepID=A0A9P5H1X0_9HYPO|nr:hypothetical protein G7Z17_g10569 [Cylindrodendrum hubeiense]